jgi:signal transduction histidine kinase
MAQGNAAFWPLDAASALGAGAAQFASRNIKATVVLSVVLICGAFAAASALQMRLDRVHALNQARYFEARHAADIASVADAGLERMAAFGRSFADGSLGQGGDDALRNIVVFAPDGTQVSTLTGTTAFLHLPDGLLARARQAPILVGDGELATLTFAYDADVVAVVFDAHALAPAALLADAAVTSGGAVLSGNPQALDGAISAPVGHWPVQVLVASDDDGALAAWRGALPLYLFVILGPALVGAALAAVFVREFERRARAAQAVRALRATPAADARLLIRLAQAERGAIEAARSKAEFIAHMSHELRTPLNAVIGFSEIIEQGMFGPVGHRKYVEYARDIAAAGRGLHGKIGDILEFANVEAGRYPIATADFDLARLAQELADEHAGRAFASRIVLDFVPTATAPTHADPLAVRRIVTNLLANALAYTPAGGRIRVEVDGDDGAVTVTVRDSGPGFRPHEAHAAGNAFARFDRHGAQTGAGLGLAIAMALARRTGGALRLGSAPGQGTRTELRLPRAGQI